MTRENIVYLKRPSEITQSDRQKFAKWAANVLQMEENDELPYKPMEYSDYFWAIHGGNDFWILFDEQDNTKFYLKCRYNYQQTLLEDFARFFAAKLKCNIV